MLKRTHRSVVNPFSMHVIARRIRFAQRLSLLIIALFVFLFSASARAEIDSAIAAMPDAGLPHYRPEPVALPSDATYLTPDGSVTVIGYNDMQGLLESLNRLFIASHPGFKFNLILKGTRTAPAALTSGASAFAPMGAEFSDDDMETYRKKFGADPISIRVAHASLNPRALSAPIAIYVNKANPLTSLTTEQVTRLFTQPNLTWTDFGWTDEPGRSNVHPIGLTATTALGIYMTRHAFSHAPFASNFKGFVQSADVVKQVGEDPSAVGVPPINRLPTQDENPSNAHRERCAPPSQPPAVHP